MVRGAHRHRALVLAALVLLVALSALGLRRLAFDADVLRLLPAGGQAIPAFRAFVSTFGTLDDLYIVFTAPDGQVMSDYRDEVDAWVEALRGAPEIARVETGAPDELVDWSWLAERQLLLLDEAHLGEALSRLSPAGMRVALASAREMLTVPSAEIAAMVRQDPLGFLGLLRTQLGGDQGTLGLGLSAEGWTADRGRKRLIIVRPSQPPYDTSFSHALHDRLQAIAAATAAEASDDPDHPPLTVDFAGGHLIALEVEDVVRQESIWNGVTSLAFILPLLLIVFRSPWLVAIGAIPSAVSLLVVLGALGLAGVTLSAAAAGAAAMLFGLGVDGVVLLYVAHRLTLAEGHDGREAIARLGGPSVSMLLGMWTTAATFIGLLVVDFPSLEQLGLVIGASMAVCGLLTLVIVPAALPARAPLQTPPTIVLGSLAAAVAARRRTILVAAMVVTLILGWVALGLRVNPTLDRLRSVTPGALQYQAIAEAFALPTDVYVGLSRGPDLEALLEGNEAFVGQLRSAAEPPAVQAPSMLLPSTAAQRARAALIRARAPAVASTLAALSDTGREVGFRAGTFSDFEQRLPQLVSGTQTITWDGLTGHGLDAAVSRMVARTGDDWVLATYAFPTTPTQVAALDAAARVHGVVLTGLSPVNHELSARFTPEFLKGLGAGTVVVIALLLITFRSARLALLALAPTALGLIWAAGILAWLHIELDLFAVFAVVTFVGIGVDYGIHLVYRSLEHDDAQRASAEMMPIILVAGFITLLGYGTLIMSSYPPLQSIGLVSAVSVGTLIVASVIVMPALLMRPRT